jgi:hypothetical protein
LTLANDADAFLELQQTGIYKRGDYHITFSWYPGREKIRTWRYEAWAESLFQWSVQLPLSVVGRERSILLGVWQFVSGVGITLNRLTGVVPTLFPRYTPGEMDEQLSKAYFQWLQDFEGFKLTATEVIDVGRRPHDFLHGSTRSGRYPVIFEHPKLGTLDFRTFVPHIRNSLERILFKERQAVDARLGPQRMSIIATHISSLGEEGAIDRYLDMWHEAYLEAIKSRRRAIDNLSGFPDLTKTVLDQERASFLVARIVHLKAREREQKIEKEMNRWKDGHTVLACTGKFVDRHQAEVVPKVYGEVPLFEGIREAMVEAGLNDLALLMGTQARFEQSQGYSELRKSLAATRNAGVVKIVFLKVPSRWTVEEHRTSGETYYALEFTRKVQVCSSAPFWRWQTFAARYVSWIWNSSFFLLNQASIALRRWNMLRTSFDIRVPAVNPSTGEFDTTPIRTLRGRLAAILDCGNKESSRKPGRASTSSDSVKGCIWILVGLTFGRLLALFLGVHLLYFIRLVKPSLWWLVQG